MQKRKLTVTVYDKTTAQQLTSITECKKVYEELGLGILGLGQARIDLLDKLFKRDIMWLEFVLNRHPVIEREIQVRFNALKEWLLQLKNKPQGVSPNDFDRHLKDCYVQLLAILLIRYSGPTQKEELIDQENFEKIRTARLQEDYKEALGISDKIYSAYSKQPFENIIYKGKYDYLQTNYWPRLRNNWEFRSFITELNRHFFVFMGNSINEIFLSEMRRKIGIDQTVHLAKLSNIFNYIIGSFTQFRRFVNRNFLYNLISDSLKDLGSSYEILPTMQNLAKKYQIIITRSNFENYIEKTYDVTCYGIENSPRFIRDHVITFGRNADDEFTNDVSLPNTQDLDSIFSFIFINSNGLNLVDISADSAVKLKIKPGERKELEDDMVIVLGTNHQFHVKIERGIAILGMSEFFLKLSDLENDNSTITRTINILPNRSFSIGRNSNCDLYINALDIKNHHADIESENNKFYLRDIIPSDSNEFMNGSYFKLKSLSQKNDGKPSDLFTLKDADVFVIKSFYFLAREVN